MNASLEQRRDVAALKAAHPIAGIVTGYGIALQPSGKALLGRCPFHEDTGRPNLHIYPNTGSYFCFRCGEGGDAIDFVMRRERLGFRAACDQLRALPPRPFRPRTLPGTPDWERLPPDQLRVMDLAWRVYRETLRQTPAALAYLGRRGVSRDVIDAGVVGYSDGRRLADALAADLAAARTLGLLRQDQQGALVERFAGRVVVAERRGGQTIWCLGRAWTASGPKFLGLTGARPLLGLERIRGQGHVYLVEGLFDWLTALSWGLPACSLCGTHGTERQLQALEGATRVYGVFDADVAGCEASERFGRRFGARWRAVRLPDGSDLNDLGRRPDGRRQFLALVCAAEAGARHDLRTDGRGAEEGAS